MRIWSLHPKYLDAKGLVALWRETLLAKHVLEGKTKGYTNHPQLERFKASSNPSEYINAYLNEVWIEAQDRGYYFNKDKIGDYSSLKKLSVTSGQMEYEKQHLLNKLKERDLEKFRKFNEHNDWAPHPLFKIINGQIELWERL